MHETLPPVEEMSTSMHHLDGLLLARLWPPERIVLGMRVSKWIRDHLAENAESVWLQVSSLPPQHEGLISAKEVCRNLARLQHGCVNVDMGIYNCDYHHVSPILLGITKAWRCGWQGAVRSLDLSETSLGTSEVELLARVLSGCAGLTSLVLSGNALRDDDMQPLAQALECCPSLQHVDLSYNRIRPAGVASTCHILAACPQLQSMILNNNRMGDSGAEILAGALTQCTALQYLSLKENGIGDAGARSLAVQLPRCSALLELDLSSNRVGAEWAVMLSAQARGGGCSVLVHAQNSLYSGWENVEEEEDEDEDWCSEEDEDDDDEFWGPATPGERWRESGAMAEKGDACDESAPSPKWGRPGFEDDAAREMIGRTQAARVQMAKEQSTCMSANIADVRGPGVGRGGVAVPWFLTRGAWWSGAETRSRWRRSGGSWTRHSQKKSGGGW